MKPPKSRRETAHAAAPFVLAAVAVLGWAIDVRPVVVGALVLGVAHQAYIGWRNRGERTLRLQAVGGTVLTGLLVAAFAGPRAGILLLPAGLACLLVSLGLLQNADVRGRAARALGARRIPADGPDTAWARDRAALALAAPVLVCAALLVPVALWSPHFHFPDEDYSPPKDQQPEDRTPADALEPAARGPQRPPDSRESGGPGLHPLGFGKLDPRTRKLVLVEAKPTDASGRSTGNAGPVYLRTLPLADTPQGWVEDTSGARRIADKDDGASDGWCTLAPPPAAADFMKLSVHQQVLEHAASGEIAVPCPPDTSSIDFSSVRAVKDGAVLTLPWRSGDLIDYHLVARLPSRVRRPTAATRVVTPRAVAPSAAVPRELRTAAQNVTARAADDLARVQAVVAHLRDEFEYDDAADIPPGVDPVAALAKSRRGTCLQFAQAGVLMLESLGIPARVGTGFLVSRWDAQRQLYVGRANDCHAWVEVNFAGCGWVIFDPTPTGAPDLDSVDPTLPSTGFPWPWGEGDFNPLETAVDAVRAAFRRLETWIEDHPWTCAAAVLGAALLLARAARRRRRRHAGESVDAPAPRDAWDLVVAALARRGLRRRPSQTATEFAASVAAARDAFAPFVALTARRQAVRFGGRGESAEDESDLEAFHEFLRTLE